jgi:DNA-binding response OmpR family regulator
VLVVARDPDAVAAARDALATAGYQVSTASSAEQGLRRARAAATPFDVVVIDLALTFAGSLLAARMRDERALRDVPIVGMSERAAAPLVTGRLSDAYLPLPLQTTQLLQIVHRTVTLGTLRRMRNGPRRPATLPPLE